MNALDRRDFLGLSLALAASLQASEPHMQFPSEPRERLSVSTYPFRSLISTPRADEDEPSKPGMTLEQFAATIVPKLNVPGLEPWSHHFQST